MGDVDFKVTVDVFGHLVPTAGSSRCAEVSWRAAGSSFRRTDRFGAWTSWRDRLGLA
jgi:hypothetical protein